MYARVEFENPTNIYRANERLKNGEGEYIHVDIVNSSSWTRFDLHRD